MSEEKLSIISELAEVILTKIEFGELVNDPEYIITCLREELKENADLDYESEDEASDSETDEEDIIKEKITINKTDDGFYEIKDNELEECDIIGRPNKKCKCN